MPNNTPFAERPLSPRQKLFVREFVVSGNATAAARAAGYTERSARTLGHSLRQKPNVARAIAAARGGGPAGAVTQQRVLDEMGRMAFANMLDFAVVDGEGRLALDLRALDRGRAAALKELVIEEVTERDGRSRRTVRLKLADKQGALLKLLPLAPLFPVRPAKDLEAAS